jgi:predicted Zn-dependent protease
MRLAIQAAGLAALVAVLAGDAVTMTKLAVALPTMLLQNGYSRALETEADTYAFERMKQIGLSPVYFAEIMELLEKRRDSASKKDAKDSASDGSAGYLSTHPATAERIQRARNYR